MFASLAVAGGVSEQSSIRFDLSGSRFTVAECLRLSPQCGATPQKRTLNKFRWTEKAENAGPRETVCGGKPPPEKGIETGG